MADTEQPKPKTPPSEPKVLIVNGMLMPDADSVRSVLYTLHQKMKGDAALAQQYQADPRRVLGSIGLNADIQTEVMKLEGIPIPEGMPCSETCMRTCLITI